MITKQKRRIGKKEKKMRLIEKNIDFKVILKNICNVKFSRFQENIVERGPVNRHNLLK